MDDVPAVTLSWSDEPVEREPHRYRPIRDYAIIGDCHGAALIARDGGIDWCCLERFDAEPAFCRVLDAGRRGVLEVRPDEAFRASRTYIEETNVLRTTFETANGRVALIDFMPLRRAPGAAEDDHVSLEAPGWLVRVIEGLEGRVRLRVRYRPSGPGFDREPPGLRSLPDGVAAEHGPALHADFELSVEADLAHTTIEIAAGERRHLVVAPARLDREVSPEQIDRLLDETTGFWKEWISHCQYHGPYREAVRRSALVLKLSTYAPSGALVAAPTTSLPEDIGGERNWDYRYCWLRDAALVLYELVKLGYSGEAARFDAFLDEHCLHSGLEPKIMYGICGERDLDERTLDHLEGYCASRPVRAGNGAHDQLQIDIYGKVLDWAYIHVAFGGTFDEAGMKRLRDLADRAGANWREADHGIWEMRCEPREHLHGKIMSWVALDRAMRLFPDEAERWREVRDAVVEEVRRRGIDPEGGYLLQSLDHPGSTDAAVLVAPAVGYPLDQETLARTVGAIEAQLRSGDCVFRYKGDDGLSGEEGGFLLCSFWLIDAYLVLGREAEARAMFERLLAQANDVGLYSEQLEPDSEAFLGNFPQAFTHLGLIGSAINLELFAHGGREALRGGHAERGQRRLD